MRLARSTTPTRLRGRCSSTGTAYAAGTWTDGVTISPASQVAIFKALGASNTDGVKVTPGAGQSLEDPGNLGNLLAANASVTFFGQGQCLYYRYEEQDNSWLLQSS